MSKMKIYLLMLVLSQIFAAVTAFADPAPSPEVPCEVPVRELPADDVESPLSEVVPRCMANRQPSTTPEDLIRNDVPVCACLRSNNVLFSSLPSTTPQRAPTVNSKIETLNTTFANTRALNTISVSRHSPRNTEVGLMTNTGAEVRKRLANGTLVTPGTSPTTRVSPTMRRGPQISTSLSRVNEIPETNRNNQCVTYMEYSAQRELPYDNAFFSFLQSTTLFREEDWSLSSLRTSYDAATPENRPAILARMVFLSRNPQFASLLRARPSERFPQALIDTKRREFFNLMRTLAPASGSTCASQVNGCWREAQASGAYSQFAENASTFLMNNDVVDIVSAQSADEYAEQFTRISTNTDPKSDIPRTPEGYFAYLQNTNREIAFSCSGTSAPATCFDRFNQHCSVVNQIHDRIRKGIQRTGEDIVNELDAEMVVHGSIDPNQNMSFDAFNDMMCRKNYTNAAGETSNFFTFQSRICTGTSMPAECSDRRALLQRFNTEFPEGGSEADKNVRQGFAQALTRTNFTTVSETQIATINQIIEAPAELRARFDGGYPTINSAGNLVPYVPPTPGRTPASTSSSASVASSAATSFTGPGQSNAIPQDSESRPVSSSSRNTQRQNNFDDGSSAETFQPQQERQAPSRSQSGSTRSRPSFVPNVTPRIPSAPVSSVSSSVNNDRQPDPNEDRDADPEVRGATVSGVALGSQGGGAVSTGGGNSGPTSQPVVEMPRRRSRNSGGQFNRAALLDGKYVDQSVEDSSPTSELEARPAVNVPVSTEVLRSAISDLSTLSNNPTILETVNSASDEIVKLELTDGDVKAVVYAIKEGSQVTFSLTPPARTPAGRSPASVSENEMNVKLQPDLYEVVNSDPSALRNYPVVVESAMRLPGDVVRLNVITPDAAPLMIYVDKRGPQLRFTTDDQSVIRAYRP